MSNKPQVRENSESCAQNHTSLASKQAFFTISKSADNMISSFIIWTIVILKTLVWKFMKRYCVFLYMFSLLACAQSYIQGTWENQI